MKLCFHCKKPLEVSGKAGRGDACPACGSDLKVCLNCRFYDRVSHNECREPSAEHVAAKDMANFCEFFEFREDNGNAGTEEDPLKRLKELFKG